MTEVASLADRLGYSRYWMAEHHSSTVAHASPEILIPLVAGMTDRIRVGTAGVLLPYRSPLQGGQRFPAPRYSFPRSNRSRHGPGPGAYAYGRGAFVWQSHGQLRTDV